MQLVESASGLTKKSGNRWLVVIAAPGKGESGTYLKEVLKEQGPAAIPAKTRSWIGHSAPQLRDARDKLGSFPEGAYYDDNYDLEKFPEGALVAELDVRESYRTMIEELGDEAELSIYVDGDKDANGVVTNMYPHRANSVDLVAYGGLEGSGFKQKLYETYSIPETPSGDKKEGNVDPELKALFEKLEAKVDAIASAKVDEETKATQAKVDEEAVGKAVDEALAGYEEKVTAIEAAELLPSQVESLKAMARKGEDVAPLIETYKGFIAEAKTVLAESVTDKTKGGFRLNESLKDTTDFGVGQWGSR